ncbi:hypothetical protein KVA01_04100 [Kocuria varians]|uniref:Sap-like sulfolipid-1-addressing protein n=2 Tax=Kocuria varians TaxID=1272 RepID=A0A4Y4CZ90_KOCVA|nr:hypothetical protein [Kocuria varians]GEC98255.1 hypothetical protein KVA01_04100 [Kocuria varians]
MAISALVGGTASVLGLGLVMGFSPTVYALVLRILTHHAHPARAVHFLTLGMALGTTLLLVVFRTVDPQTLTALLEDRTKELLVRRGVDLTAGVLLAVLAVVELVRWRTRPRTAHRAPKSEEMDSPRRMVTLGLLNTVVGVSGPATMYIAGRLFTGLSPHLAVQAVFFLVFLLAVVGPYWLITWAWEKVPALSRNVERVTGWVAAQDPRPLLALGLAVAAAVFLVMGVRD